MTDETHAPEGQQVEPSEIARFFDAMSGTRNAAILSNPIIDYEQQVRARTVLAGLRPRAGETILDIGCGNARDILPMLRDGAVIVGVDLSEGMIRQARADLAAAGYRDVRLEVGDATALQFADGTFDKIVCSEVIEHIPDADKAMAEMHRVLRPGGILVLSTPNRRSWYGFDRYVLWSHVLRKRWNHPYDNWRSVSELRALVERHGFHVQSAASACYIPGFLLTYRLPRILQALVVSIVRRGERLASRAARGSGYTLLVRADKVV